MAAFKLASKGHTMADSSYSSEVKSILSFIEMHHPSSVPSPSGKEKDLLKAMNFDIESSVASRFLNKIKGHHQVVIHLLFFNVLIFALVICIFCGINHHHHHHHHHHRHRLVRDILDSKGRARAQMFSKSSLF